MSSTGEDATHSRTGSSSDDMSMYAFARNMLSGGISGIVSKTIGAPIDRVKLILQTQAVNSDVTQRYTGKDVRVITSIAFWYEFCDRKIAFNYFSKSLFPVMISFNVLSNLQCI